ncbi:hypothetical protein PoB_005361500 [Plakobranchus ocellatus]|uniref:LamG-like jellyroll fold domain-containing protein n=1 Tax=Plakobranchus ocellatus TaxID=259542 RepID=A0AAV4C5Z1_9GAST|nr:hypothetical protein PoB_005361500 [Plakobranchus ocellatus]
MLARALLCVAFLAQLTDCLRPPKYVWPLGNTTVHREVMSGRDAHLPANDQCFVFSDGYPDFPYRALTLTGEDGSFVDFYMRGKSDLNDLAVSMWVFPIGEPEGTIINYMCETGNVIKIAVLESLLFVSFWDEYGVSVGATAVPELLVADAWNHLVISREYESGRIKVFHNGGLVDDIDDDFPNKIPLPGKGSMRLGSSQKDKGDTRFKGRFACFQFYMTTPTEAEVKASKDFCKPDKWKIIPEITLETRTIDGVEKGCVTDYVEPSEMGNAEPKECEVMDMACLVSGLNWNWVLRKNNWKASSRDTAYFHRIAKDQIPTASDNSILGDFFATDKKVCTRACLRVKGCRAFSATPLQPGEVEGESAANATTRCALYKKILEATQDKPGAVYFSLR